MSGSTPTGQLFCRFTEPIRVASPFVNNKEEEEEEKEDNNDREEEDNNNKEDNDIKEEEEARRAKRRPEGGDVRHPNPIHAIQCFVVCLVRESLVICARDKASPRGLQLEAF